MQSGAVTSTGPQNEFSSERTAADTVVVKNEWTATFRSQKIDTGRYKSVYYTDE